jgi:hypothetical protein
MRLTAIMFAWVTQLRRGQPRRRGVRQARVGTRTPSRTLVGAGGQDQSGQSRRARPCCSADCRSLALSCPARLQARHSGYRRVKRWMGASRRPVPRHRLSSLWRSRPSCYLSSRSPSQRSTSCSHLGRADRTAIGWASGSLSSACRSWPYQTGACAASA